MSKTSLDFLAWSNTIGIFGQGAAKCFLHSQAMLEGVVILNSPKSSMLRKNPGIGPKYTKKLLMRFKIYTDGSERQLGAIITQNNRPIVFFSGKHSACQQKYSMTGIEHLS
ncbi:hypothetical protein ACHAW6_000173 [Cyclotella cf. meneghiniana]